ncbi:MAG TPA: type II toxin-antitoxin system HicB family antitoxin [Nitrososphaerales archaeon]
MTTKNFHIVFKRQKEDGFVVRCLELPGCLSEGKTEDEALRNIEDAIKLYLKDVEREAKEKNARVIQVAA